MIRAFALAVIPALLLPWLLLPIKNPILFATLPVVPLALVYAQPDAGITTGGSSR